MTRSFSHLLLGSSPLFLLILLLPCYQPTSLLLSFSSLFPSRLAPGRLATKVLLKVETFDQLKTKYYQCNTDVQLNRTPTSKSHVPAHREKRKYLFLNHMFNSIQENSPPSLHLLFSSDSLLLSPLFSFPSSPPLLISHLCLSLFRL